MIKSIRKQSILFIVLISLLGTMALTACSGSAVIDVNMNPDTGTGNIVITGDEDNPDEVNVDVDNDGDQDLSQILLFGIVVALLLGTVAIVVSTSRRRA